MKKATESSNCTKYSAEVPVFVFSHILIPYNFLWFHSLTFAETCVSISNFIRIYLQIECDFANI